MATIKDVTIKFTADTDDLKKAKAELGDLTKKVEEKNKAEQKAAEDNRTVAQKRLALIESEKRAIDDLKAKIKNTYVVGDIEAYSAAIKEAEGRIRTLGGEVEDLGKKTKEVEASNNKLSDTLGGVNKAYGFLRTAANIIPGLGISGLILLGWETLVGLVKTLTGGLNENNEAVKQLNKSLDEQQKIRSGLEDDIQSQIEAQLVSQGKLSKSDADRFAAQRQYSKRLQELEKDRVKEVIEQLKLEGVTVAVLAQSYEKFGLTYDQANRIIKEGTLEKGTLSNVDDQIKRVNNVLESMNKFDAEQKRTVKSLEELLKETSNAISRAEYETDKEKRLKAEKEANEKLLKQRKEYYDGLAYLQKESDKDLKDAEKEAEKDDKKLQKIKSDYDKIQEDADKLRLNEANKERKKREKEEEDELQSKLKKQLEFNAKIFKASDAAGKAAGDLLAGAIEGNEDVLKKASIAILDITLDTIEKQLIATQVAATTSATVTSFSQPDSVATFGLSGLARSAVMVALISAAFEGGKALLHNAVGFHDGGFTGDGHEWQPAGIVHKGEFVQTKENTIKYRKDLEAMHSGEYGQYINKTYILPKMMANDSKRVAYSGLDEYGVSRALRKNRNMVIENAEAIGKAVARNINTKELSILKRRGIV